MKKLIFILVLLASCSTVVDHGVQTVKTIDGLKVKTHSIYHTDYPKYMTGDTVIIWRAIEAQNDYWYISTTDIEIPQSNIIVYKRGVIQ